MANPITEPQAPRQFFESYWNESGATTRSAIAESLTTLSETLRSQLTPRAAAAYLAVLGHLTQPELVLAFTRAMQECKFFPPPATLLELSGRAVTGDPIAQEAKEKLQDILQAMRGPHGPKLRPILGKVLYGTEDDPRDENGRCHHIAIRSESTPFPLDRRLKAALTRLGWGDITIGIAVIAEHPALQRKWEQDDGPYRQNQLRAADEILRRFTEAYREI